MRMLTVWLEHCNTSAAKTLQPEARAQQARLPKVPLHAAAPSHIK